MAVDPCKQEREYALIIIIIMRHMHNSHVCVDYQCCDAFVCKIRVGLLKHYLFILH